MSKVIILLGFDNIKTKLFLETFNDYKFIRIGANPKFDIYRNFAALPNSPKVIENTYAAYSNSKVDFNLLDFFKTDFYSQYIRKAMLASSRGCFDCFSHPNSQTSLETSNAILSKTYTIFQKYSLEKIDKMICAYTPHSIVDWSAYYLVRWLGKNCISFDGLPNCNLSVSFLNLLDQIDNDKELIPLKINKKLFPQQKVKSFSFADSFLVKTFQTPSYMKNKFVLFPKLSFNKHLIMKICNLLKIELKFSILKFAKVLGIINKDLSPPSPSPYLPHAILGRIIKQTFSPYISQPNSVSFSNISSLGKYIYLPWQFQPEASTETRGFIFADQLLFLKTIRLLIPNDWKIVIKENPLSFTPRPYLRHKGYWNLVKNTENTLIINPNTSSKELILNSLLVASPTGTACMEANQFGIPSIYGGQSIFSNSPLAYRITKFTDVKEFQAWYEKINAINKEVRLNLMKDYILELDRYSLPGKFHYEIKNDDVYLIEVLKCFMQNFKKLNLNK
jgi:hypothetical protein